MTITIAIPYLQFGLGDTRFLFAKVEEHDFIEYLHLVLRHFKSYARLSYFHDYCIFRIKPVYLQRHNMYQR